MELFGALFGSPGPPLGLQLGVLLGPNGHQKSIKNYKKKCVESMLEKYVKKVCCGLYILTKAGPHHHLHPSEGFLPSMSAISI